MRVVEAGIEDEGYAMLLRRPLLQCLTGVRPGRKLPWLECGRVFFLDLADHAEQPVPGVYLVSSEHWDGLGSAEHTSLPLCRVRGVVEP